MATINLDKDRELSFSIINYLSASYRGQIAALTLLGQFNHGSFEIAELEKNQVINDRINVWFEALLTGETLFTASWESPETFEAQSALGLLSKLKPDLQETADKIQSYLNGEEAISSASAQWLFSALTRSAYARDVYLRGFVTFGQAFKKPEIVQKYLIMLPACEERILGINQGIDLFRAVNLDLTQLEPEFINTLLNLCEDLAAVFKTHIHDINLICSNYKGGITAANLGFTEDEAKSWEERSLTLDTAGYWRAYDFSPAETMEWAKAGVLDPASAFGWKISRFTPTTAKIWVVEQIPVQAAKLWGDAGYTPKETKEQLLKGLSEPKAKE